MSLSEQELRALREIEQSLLADDPKFRAAVTGAQNGSRFALSLQGIALFVLGLVLLIGGIALSQGSMWFVSLSVLGFLLMLGSSIWMLRAGERPGISLATSTVQDSRSTRAPRNNSGFTDRMDERFRSRFEDGQ